jgi:hypothetical protein
MPRLRFRLPIEVDVSSEVVKAGKAAHDLLTAVRDSDLPGALARAVEATRDAVQSRSKRRPRP